MAKEIRQEREQLTKKAVARHVHRFTRLELAFYGTIILTAIILAVSTIYLQSRSLQVQQRITKLNADISDGQTRYENAKQQVNELSAYDRIAQVAQEAGLTISNDNIKKVE